MGFLHQIRTKAIQIWSFCTNPSICHPGSTPMGPWSIEIWSPRLLGLCVPSIHLITGASIPLRPLFVAYRCRQTCGARIHVVDQGPPTRTPHTYASDRTQTIDCTLTHRHTARHHGGRAANELLLGEGLRSRQRVAKPMQPAPPPAPIQASPAGAGAGPALPDCGAAGTQDGIRSTG